MVTECDYKEHIAAADLHEEKQIGTTIIYPVEGGNCRYIGIKARCGCNYQSITDVYTYDNNNVLIIIVKNQTTLYQIVSESTCSRLYNAISLKVYDEMYRVAYTEERVCVISDKCPHQSIQESKWKNIIDINNDIAVINSRGNYYSLVRLNFDSKWSNELQGSKEIAYLNYHLYKFRDLETGSKYQLYNANLPAKSNPKTLYDDVLCISEQIAVGIINNAQWDFIKVYSKINNYLEVAYSSYREPVYDGENINLVELDDYGNEKPYRINIWGANLSEEPEKEIEEPVVETKAVALPQNGSKTEEETTVQQDNVVNIGKFIVVTNDSARKSENGDYVFCKYSYKKACNCEGYPCWILIKQKLIIITEKESKRPKTLKCRLKGELPEEFELFSNVSEDNKWLFFENSVNGTETEILSKAVDAIAPMLKKLSATKREIIEAQQKRDIEDTKDILRLKAIYDFLKLQGFDNSSIFDAVSSLFPEIDAYIDYTNVKQNSYYGWKGYVENVDKLKRIMPKGYIDEDKVIEEIKFSDKEKTIFDYYTNVKEYPLDIAIEHIQEESPTGTQIRMEYETLMRLEDIVDNQRKMLQHEIIEDLINNFTVMADTSEILQLPEQTNEVSSSVNKAFEADLSKSTDIILKDNKFELKLNETIKYDAFENKKVHKYDKPVSYIHIGKNIIILLNENKALEYDNEHTRQLQIRGNGEDKKFDQEFTAINEIIYKQRTNGTRIYVFVTNNDDSCRFFDEFQCIKSELVPDEEENRKVIMFTMKSLIRYYTDKR